MSVLRGTIYLSISRVASLLLNMWAIGRYVHWLGDESWGGIALMIVLMGFCVTICDLGLNIATLNALVKAASDKDQEAANRVLATTTAIYGCAFVPIGLIYALAFQFGYVRAMGHNLEGALYFALAAGTTMLSLISFSQNSALSSRGHYSYIAFSSTLFAFVNTGISLLLIYRTGQPWGFWAGNFGGLICTLIANEIQLRKIGFGAPRIGFFKSELQGVKAYLKRSWITNTASLANGLDRIALGRVVSEASLGIYDQATRIPATLISTMPIAQVFPAEVARVSQDGEGALYEAYKKLSSATMAMMMAVLFIPSACAESYLRLIYPVYHPVMLPIFILASLDAAFSLYGSLFAVFAGATGRPHLTAPFVWFMLVGTALLAFPVASLYGLIGVAAMRAILQLIQFYPLEWAARKFIMPGMALREILTKKAFIVAVAAVFWVLGYRIIYALGWQYYALAGIGVSSVMSYIFMACLYGTGAIWLPQRLAGLLPKFVRNLSRRPT